MIWAVVSKKGYKENFPYRGIVPRIVRYGTQKKVGTKSK